MRRLLVGETEVLGERTAYYLLEETAGTAMDYGVEIVRGAERASAAGLSLLGDRVWTLAERMLAGGVTPATLRDVVDDWLLC